MNKYIFFILPFAVLGILINFALVLIPLRTRTKPMEWTAAHDVLLCREMLAINPFKAKWKTIQRTKMWETIVHHLEQIEPSFKVSVRSIRDGYSLLAKKFRKRMPSEQKASGISPEMSELDVLMEELTGLEDMSQEEKANESEEKNRKTEQDRVKALDMRKKAMEKLSETTSRKLQEENQPKKKARRSTSDTIKYLKGELRGKIDVSLYFWPVIAISIFDNLFN